MQRTIALLALEMPLQSTDAQPFSPFWVPFCLSWQAFEHSVTLHGSHFVFQAGVSWRMRGPIEVAQAHSGHVAPQIVVQHALQYRSPVANTNTAAMSSVGDESGADVVLKALSRLDSKATIRQAAEDLSAIIRVRCSETANQQRLRGGGCSSCRGAVLAPTAPHTFCCYAGSGSRQPGSAGAERLHHHGRVGAQGDRKEGKGVVCVVQQSGMLCACRDRTRPAAPAQRLVHTRTLF
jgi:hypothetical protein